MLQQEFWVTNWTIDLNTYIKKERGHMHGGSRLKKEWSEIASWSAKSTRLKKVKRVNLEFHWYMPNTKKDKDNIAFGKKFIIDGLVDAGVLENDGWNNILGFKDEFILAPYLEQPKVLVKIEGMLQSTPVL